MEILEIQDLIPPALEPKRAHRWIIEWAGINAFQCKTFGRPSGSFGEIVIDYINTKRYWQGKWEWKQLTLGLVDYIAPSAAQKCMEWIRLGYENVTGRAGYKEFYAAKNFKLKVLDPAGAVIERWDFFNIFPVDLDNGGLDYSSAEPLMCNVTLRFDIAVGQH